MAQMEFNGGSGFKKLPNSATKEDVKRLGVSDERIKLMEDAGINYDEMLYIIHNEDSIRYMVDSSGQMMAFGGG